METFDLSENVRFFICDNKNIELNLNINDVKNNYFLNINFLPENLEQNININLLKEGANFIYLGLHGLKNNSCQTILQINHQAKNTKSEQIFRGIYGQNSIGTFHGKVIIEKSAQHSLAKQDYKSILLSDNAKAKVKPVLEIYNHDISASHGASLGQIDELGLFYLLSRGINEEVAKAMLLNGFLQAILDKIGNNSIKENYSELIDKNLKKLF